MIDWIKYVDAFGLIKGHNENGGDCCQRCGMFFVGQKWIGADKHLFYTNTDLEYLFHVDLNKLECPGKPNHYRRHPDKLMWYSRCNVLSRDQATPLVIGMGVFKFKWKLFWFMFHHIKRLGFMTNTRKNHQWETLELQKQYGNPRDKWNYKWKLPDFCGPEFWGLYIRGFRFWLFYPLLIIFDIETLIGAIVRRFNKDDDVLNHVMISQYANRCMPTPTSWLTDKINDNEKLYIKMSTYCSRIDLPMDQIYYYILM